jgi:hypothetical protein
VQFNHEADTVKTIASPKSSLNDSNEDNMELIQPDTSSPNPWGHVDEIEEVGSQENTAQCILADLNALQSPTTQTHQSFLEFLFGKPNIDAPHLVESSHVIGDREVLIFETNEWSPVSPVQPVQTKKPPTPVSAIEGLTFMPHFQVDPNTEEDSKSIHLGAFLLPQCGTNCVDPASTVDTSIHQTWTEFQKKREDMVVPPKNEDVSSICSSDSSSSLGLDMVDFIRKTMDTSDVAVSPLRLGIPPVQNRTDRQPSTKIGSKNQIPASDRYSVYHMNDADHCTSVRPKNDDVSSICSSDSSSRLGLYTADFIHKTMDSKDVAISPLRLGVQPVQNRTDRYPSSKTWAESPISDRYKVDHWNDGDH